MSHSNNPTSRCRQSPLATLLFGIWALLALMPSLAAAETISGNLLLQAKGEVEVYHNGRKIVLRDKADHDQHYRVKIPERDFNVGDVIVLHIRSPFVYRAISAAINLSKKEGQIPVKKTHWHFAGANADPRKITTATLQSGQPLATATPDPHGEREREKLGFIPHAKNGSDWVKTPEQLNGWYCVGFVLTQQMISDRLPVN